MPNGCVCNIQGGCHEPGCTFIPDPPSVFLVKLTEGRCPFVSAHEDIVVVCCGLLPCPEHNDGKE